MRYIALVTDDLHLDHFRAKIRERAPEAEAAAMTIAEQMRREGLAQGLAQGLMEGRAQERSAVLTKLLALKFGPLEPAHQARITAATPEQLDRWLEQVLTAGSIDAVLHA